ncbi:PREDICTED: uncharacterized protein LOC106149941 [Chinchilla lanigera]|uniref:uncharacterized protein LOC106149941 n=1 Tax=Chinchilla lanigera TaxID=34839 RepID=UPI000696756F|nr:PREDICTED: uncharacterized protein LOC106149941 [Chinchilla lanigera]
MCFCPSRGALRLAAVGAPRWVPVCSEHRLRRSILAPCPISPYFKPSGCKEFGSRHSGESGCDCSSTSAARIVRVQPRAAAVAAALWCCRRLFSRGLPLSCDRRRGRIPCADSESVLWDVPATACAATGVCWKDLRGCALPLSGSFPLQIRHHRLPVVSTFTAARAVGEKLTSALLWPSWGTPMQVTLGCCASAGLGRVHKMDRFSSGAPCRRTLSTVKPDSFCGF